MSLAKKTGVKGKGAAACFAGTFIGIAMSALLLLCGAILIYRGVLDFRNGKIAMILSIIIGGFAAGVIAGMGNKHYALYGSLMSACVFAVLCIALSVIIGGSEDWEGYGIVPIAVFAISSFLGGTVVRMRKRNRIGKVRY